MVTKQLVDLILLRLDQWGYGRVNGEQYHQLIEMVHFAEHGHDALREEQPRQWVRCKCGSGHACYAAHPVAKPEREDCPDCNSGNPVIRNSCVQSHSRSLGMGH